MSQKPLERPRHSVCFTSALNKIFDHFAVVVGDIVDLPLEGLALLLARVGHVVVVVHHHDVRVQDVGDVVNKSETEGVSPNLL